MADSPIIPAGIELAPGVRIDASAIRIQASRGSGPGGQNVNKVNTRIEIWVPLSALRGMPPDALARLRGLAGSRLTVGDEVHLTGDEHRSQEGNRRAVFERLRELLIEAKRRPKTRRKTKPGRAARERRLDSKRRRSEVKAARRSEGD